ncbi:hypothetical protein VPH35_137714 [Triticum aestivum]
MLPEPPLLPVPPRPVLPSNPGDMQPVSSSATRDPARPQFPMPPSSSSGSRVPPLVFFLHCSVSFPFLEGYSQLSSIHCSVTRYIQLAPLVSNSYGGLVPQNS